MKFALDINNVNYIKIVYKDVSGTSHCSKAIVKQIGEKEIIACTKADIKPKIDTPQEVNLSFACDDGLYKATTILKYISNLYDDDSYVYFRLKTPEEIEYHQDREYFRVRAGIKVIIYYNQPDTEQTQSLECYAYDISANGIRVWFMEPTDISQNVKLEILFDGRKIYTNAHCVRTDFENKISMLSFKFNGIKEQDVDYISQFCIKKQLEIKRSQLL